MQIKFVTVCPICHTTKRNDFKGLGESHAKWLTNDSKQILWNCYNCSYNGMMPVRDVEVIRGEEKK
jgi:hypothetical protein